MKESIASNNTPSDNPGNGRLLVVGIGASAGGIKALKEFFEHVPADSGLAYVVVLHLSPDHDSQLAAVLQSSSLIPVVQVTEKVEIAANTVYVISPNKSLSLLDGSLAVSPIHTVEERRAPVDIFFRTLAESKHSEAVCVVLSGTGANGSMGLKRVKENGGAAFVQNPREAEFNEMPRNSIATDLVDAILPVADIPARIIAYRDSLGTVEIPDTSSENPDDQQQALRDVLTLLRVRTGHDFANYKRATVLRRIERRLNVHSLSSLKAYSVFITEHPEESNALLKDLLISVTNFFRDKRPFQVLEDDVVPRIIRAKSFQNSIRIWVAGCATGEEAYSLAMIFAEKVQSAIDPPTIQIFATDIDESAIAFAREGLYTLNDAADVSPERLRRFFTKENDGFRIKKEIREMILFANHNVIKDPPFSRLDLITCRNMLIYFNNTAQQRVMETFHFALNPGSYMFIGSSESVDGASDLYVPINKEFRLYQSRQVSPRNYPVPEATTIHRPLTVRPIIHTKEHETRALERITYGDLHQQLLERYAPPSVLVNEEYEIVHLSENAGRYLQVAGGEATNSIFKLIRPELRLELRTALYQSVQRQVNVESRNHKIKVNDQVETINLLVRPVLQPGDISRGFILILFERSEKSDVDTDPVFTPVEPAARQLEEELVRMKLHLRTSIDQYEVQTEELKASNEELQAMNEELRSSAEELETSKEELQSVNEELITVNQELKVKVEELSQSNNNFQNLIYSTDIATIFLDRSFRVNDFTPATREIFNLLPADFGRPLSDITHRLDYHNLLHDSETALDKLQTIDREVRTTDNRFFMMRVLPYRTAEDRINGVVINFFDITRQKHAEQNLRLSEEHFRAIVSQTSVGIAETELDGTYKLVNQKYCDILGYNRSELQEMKIQDLSLSEDRVHNVTLFNSLVKIGEPFQIEERFVRKNGAVVWVSNHVTLIRDSDGNPVSIMSVTLDITEQKLSADKIKESEKKYRDLFNSIDEGFTIIEMIFDENLNPVNARFLETNQSFGKQSGLKEGTGKTFRDLVPDIDEIWYTLYGNVALTGIPNRFEQFETTLGDRWLEVYAYPYGAKENRQVAVIFNDISERKRTELNLKFLSDIKWDFARLTDTGEIMNTVAEKIKQHFKLFLVAFANVAENGRELNLLFHSGGLQLPDPSRPYLLSNWYNKTQLNKLNAGGVIQIDDVEKESEGNNGGKYVQYGIRSLITAPVMTNGRPGFLISGCRAGASHWRDDEIELFKELATLIYTRLERARAEAELAQSEERYRIALQSAEMGAWDWNVLQDSLVWTDQHYFLFGLQPDDSAIDISRLLQFIHPDDREKVWEQLQQAVNVSGIYEAEFRIVRADNGEIHWMSGYGRVIDRNGNQATRMIGVMFDITERVEASLSLQDKQLKLEIAQRAARVGIWDYNFTTQEGISTPEWEELTGYPHNGATWHLDEFLELLHVEDREPLILALKKSLAAEAGLEIELRILHPVRGLQSMLMRGSYIPSSQNSNATIIGSIIDITERKALEELKDDFIGIASHELKTPLTSIKMYAEVLLDMFSQSRDTRSSALVSKLDSQVDRLTNLIRDLLDVTRISEGKLVMQPQSTDLNKLISTSVADLQDINPRHKLVVDAGNIRPVFADRERINQVIINLVSNSVKYSPDEGEVVISTRESEDGVMVAIRDLGMGIPEELQEKVFDRFYRVNHPNVSTYPGLGLGLYISAEIIRRHGGSIGVHSKDGKGSEFYFILPYGTKFKIH